MPVFSNLRDPHRIVPLDLVQQQNYAPALSIYYDSQGDFGAAADYFISVNETGVEVTDGAKVVAVPYTNRTIADVQRDLQSSNTSFKAIALNEAISLNSGELEFNTGDQTADRGFIVRMKRHVVKYDEETRIRLLAPYNDPRDFPWYARINVGQFSQDHLGSRHVFGVPEYRNQVWSANYGFPYMDVDGEEPEFIDPRKVRVTRTPVLWEENNITMRVRDRAGYAGLIQDVDENNGIIHLQTDIEDVNGVTVSYVYKQLDYVYKDIDLNPSVCNNPYIIGQFVLFYIVPERSQPGDIKRNRTVRHKVSQTLLGAIQSLPREKHPVTLLGALQVRQTNSLEDLDISDTRVRGGGIKEETYEQAIRINKHAHGVADLGRADGVPYPGSSVVLYTLPNELKQTMSVDEIKQRASKHLALGVTPIVEFE